MQALLWLRARMRLIMGALRPPHRSPVKLLSFLASMNCLPTTHFLPKLTAEHSTLIRQPQKSRAAHRLCLRCVLWVLVVSTPGSPAACTSKDCSRQQAFSRSFSTIACSNWSSRSELAWRAAAYSADLSGHQRRAKRSPQPPGPHLCPAFRDQSACISASSTKKRKLIMQWSLMCFTGKICTLSASWEKAQDMRSWSSRLATSCPDDPT